MSRIPIARRRLDVDGADWRSIHPGWTIQAARDAYDAGKVELAQGRDRDEAVLYVIERREQDKRVPWFGRSPPPHKVTLKGIA